MENLFALEHEFPGAAQDLTYELQDKRETVDRGRIGYMRLATLGYERWRILFLQLIEAADLPWEHPFGLRDAVRRAFCNDCPIDLYALGLWQKTGTLRRRHLFMRRWSQIDDREDALIFAKGGEAFQVLKSALNPGFRHHPDEPIDLLEVARMS